MSRGAVRLRRRQSGLSLVELMIAMTIALFILAALLSIFMRSTTHYQTTTSTTRLQENARAALSIIGNDLRLGGYAGCQPFLPSAHSTVNTLTSFSPLTGTETCPATGNCSTSDTMTITFLDVNALATLTADMGSEDEALTVSTPHPLAAGDIVGVGDCDSLDITQITSSQSGGASLLHQLGGGSPGNSKSTLQKVYKAGARVMKLATINYTIGTGTTGESALFRNNQEMVDGVENMQVRYGVWNGTTSDRIPVEFLPADKVTSWGNVVSVEVSLLVSSIADTASGEYGELNSQTHSMLGTTIAPPAERRIRKVFVSTYQLRNLPQ